MYVYRLVGLRILPILFFAYLIANIEIANVGFAKLFMDKDLGITESAFGFGAGQFILAYAIFEIPSVALATKFGLKCWLALMVLAWSVCSFLMAFIQTSSEFYILRFLFGMCEAGFLSTVMLYLNTWFGKKYRAKILSLFLLANPLANAMGSVLSAWILGFEIPWGKNWQWLFALEALPAFLCGWIILCYLPKDYQQTPWLTSTQKSQIAKTLDYQPIRGAFAFRFFGDIRIYLFALVYASVSAASGVFKIWQPSIIASMETDLIDIGLFNMLPFGVAMVMMVVYGFYSDKHCFWRQKQIFILLISISCFLAGLNLIKHSVFLLEIFLCVIISCVFMFKAPFWAYLTESVPPLKLGFYLACVNALSNLMGFWANGAVGIIKDRYGNYTHSTLPLLGLGVLGIMALWLLKYLKKPSC
ncbi:hypothetical protein BKH46_00880 [Helicobacter sp. 12S02634-8]|uniref:MFS transporter n=1 Tax=Helicobacter sp. 12S02634-8 TaxID=1476199 RepID=UPI000BA561A5|nr:MFS transporter [Helicobacter sp. 12S02634-8]PAF48495.1 hypothetical protein BKH46_00880 [Helicobacter sp. 12S02634-8]